MISLVGRAVFDFIETNYHQSLIYMYRETNCETFVRHIYAFHVLELVGLSYLSIVQLFEVIHVNLVEYSPAGLSKKSRLLQHCTYVGYSFNSM